MSVPARRWLYWARASFSSCSSQPAAAEEEEDYCCATENRSSGLPAAAYENATGDADPDL